MAIFSSLIAVVAGFIVPFVVLWAIFGQFTVLWLTFWQSYVVAIIFAIVSGIITFLCFYAYPFLMASGRKKTLDSILPAAASYMAAMASAGVPPDKIFISLSSSDVEMALSEEARTIARDLEIFGYDILKTLQEASNRSPSGPLDPRPPPWEVGQRAVGDREVLLGVRVTVLPVRIHQARTDQPAAVELVARGADRGEHLFALGQ